MLLNAGNLQGKKKYNNLMFKINLLSERNRKKDRVTEFKWLKVSDLR